MRLVRCRAICAALFHQERCDIFDPREVYTDTNDLPPLSLLIDQTGSREDLLMMRQSRSRDP